MSQTSDKRLRVPSLPVAGNSSPVTPVVTAGSTCLPFSDVLNSNNRPLLRRKTYSTLHRADSRPDQTTTPRGRGSRRSREERPSVEQIRQQAHNVVISRHKLQKLCKEFEEKWQGRGVSGPILAEFQKDKKERESNDNDISSCWRALCNDSTPTAQGVTSRVGTSPRKCGALARNCESERGVHVSTPTLHGLDFLELEEDGYEKVSSDYYYFSSSSSDDEDCVFSPTAQATPIRAGMKRVSVVSSANDRAWNKKSHSRLTIKKTAEKNRLNKG